MDVILVRSYINHSDVFSLTKIKNKNFRQNGTFGLLLDEMGLDEMGLDEMGLDEIGLDEMGLDEMG